MNARSRTRLAVLVPATVAAVALVVAFSLSTSHAASARPEAGPTSTSSPAAAPGTSDVAHPSGPAAAATATAPFTIPLVSSTAADAPPGPTVVAIGDSIMDGHGVDPAEAWPIVAAERNNWQLTDLAVDGTGFLQLGNDDNTFQAQVDEAQTLNPSVVIISASSNDLGQDDSALAASTLSTMQSLRAALPQTQVIALSAFWGDTTAPPQLDSVDSALVIAANDVGATYVDIGQPLAGRPDLMQDDDVHPTADGLRMLGDAISSDLALEAPLGQNAGG